MARILLAEDDDSMRAFLKRSLEKGGHSVDAVGDGVDALAALIENRYDLLLADIVMPGLDGIELARRAADDDPALRVVLITGFAAVALRAQDEAPSGAQVLSKPMHLRELVNQLDEILAA